MKNSKILKVIGVVLALIGSITLGIGIYLRNSADSMLSALSAGSSLFGFDSSTYRSMELWENHLQNGTTVLLIGIVFLVIGTIVFIVGYLKGNEVKNPEKVAYVSPIKPAESENLSEKLTQLSKLKEQGVITEEEYKTKRQDIIERF